jgi:hypothetical protein
MGGGVLHAMDIFQDSPVSGIPGRIHPDKTGCFIVRVVPVFGSTALTEIMGHGRGIFTRKNWI